jgi:NAD(P)-dependent dehydrogenase (short-subunit alcohol dehydrogenase family)
LAQAQARTERAIGRVEQFQNSEVIDGLRSDMAASRKCRNYSAQRMAWHMHRAGSHPQRLELELDLTMNIASRFEGKTVLVTGGTSGLGLAAAERFAAEGAQVFVTGRRQKAVDVAVAKIGKNAIGVPGDVANLGDLDRLYSTIRQKAARLDVVFANAGGGAFVPLDQVTEQHFDKYFGINVKGTLFTVQKALPLMPPGSAVVLNGSIASVKGFPAFGVYGATKAALRSFARTWAVDLKGRKIRVNIVNPGTVVTPAYKSELGMNDEQIAQFEAQAAASAPSGRTGTPEEIASAVAFLASSDSSFINGAELFVDGGAAQI